MAKPPKIVVPGLNRGAGIPPGFVLGRMPGTGQGPAQLLDLTALRRVGLATQPGVAQSTSTAISLADSAVTSLSTGTSSSSSANASSITSLSTAVSTVDANQSTSISANLSKINSLSTAIGGGGGGPDPGQSTSLSQISSSLSGAISSTTSLSSAVSTVDSNQSTSLSLISSSLSGAISSTTSLSTAVSTVDSNQSTSLSQISSSLSGITTGGFQTLDVDYTDGGNTTTAETDLFTYTLAASKLGANGDRVETQWSGVFVSSGTATRQLRAYFGGTLIFDSGALTVSLAAAWDVFCTITRVSATVIRYAVSMTTEGAALAAYTSSGEVTGLTLSNTNIVKITGTAAGVGAATNDIVGKMGNVSFYPLASGAVNGALALITETVTSGSATNVSFTSIPATYRDLEIRVRGRATIAALNCQLRVRFNGDTGANYDVAGLDWNGTANNAAEIAATSCKLGYLAGATATANVSDTVIATVGDYRGTTFQKSLTSQGSLKQGTTTTTVFVQIAAGWWRNTAAITQVDVFPHTNGFVDGTVVSLYGRM